MSNKFKKHLKRMNALKRNLAMANENVAELITITKDSEDPIDKKVGDLAQVANNLCQDMEHILEHPEDVEFLKKLTEKYK